MHRKTMLGLLSLAIIFVWLISPVAAFAQDLTTTETPTDVPTDTLSEVPPTDVKPTDAAPTDTPTETVPSETTPDATVSLTDVTNQLVEAAIVVSSSDPYGILGADMPCNGGTAPAGASFHFIKPGGSPAPGYCVYDAGTNSVTKYFMDPLQQAVDWAQAGTAVYIEAGTTYSENVTISNGISSLGGDGATKPTINGWISINGLNGFSLYDLVVNGFIDVTSSNNIQIDSVTINGTLDASALGIGNSDNVDITRSTINKTGIMDAISVFDSSNINIGDSTINLSNSGLMTPDWAIDANTVDDISIYNDEIHASNGALGGINVVNSAGYVEIGGDGFNMGEYAPGEGLLVEMTNPADGSVGINVESVSGSVMVGNGTEVDISFDSPNGTSAYQTTGISVSDIEGAAMVGVNSAVNITGGDGMGVSVSNVFFPEISVSTSISPDSSLPMVPGMAAVGENLAVNLESYTGEGSFGGNGIGIVIGGVENMVILGSLQDFMDYIGYTDPLGWGGDHRTLVNVEGTNLHGFSPNVGVVVDPTSFTFASGINTNVPYGTGAIFGGGLFLTPFVVDGSDTDSVLYLGNSTFNHSGYSGLMVSGYSDVIAEGLEVVDNGFGPDYLFSFYNPGAIFTEISGDLSISNSDFLHNNGAGLIAFAEGDVDLTNVESAYNEGEGIYIGRAATATVNVLNSYIHDNGDDGIHFESWYDYFLGGFIPYNANIFNSRIINNNLYGEGEGLDFFGQGTLTICGGAVSGNGTDIYVAQPGILVRYPYYPCKFGQAENPTGSSPIVVNVEFNTQMSGSGDAFTDPERGLVFNLLAHSEQGDDILMAQAALPAGAVPGSSHSIFTSLLEGDLPAALPEGVSFLGPAFSLSFTLPDGSLLTALDGTMQVKFRIPDGILSSTGEPTSHVNIYFFDGSTWTKLPIIIANGFAYAQVDHPGIFVLTLGPTS